MPRRSSRRPVESHVVEDDDDDDLIVEEKTSSSRRGGRRVFSNTQTDDDDDDDDEDNAMFSSQAPEMTQEINAVRNSDRDNLSRMDETARTKAITDLTRLILFKALAGDPIDRTKCIKEAGISDKKISTAAFDEANMRLKNIFSFELRRLPTWMENIKNFPTKFKDRYYLINTIVEDESGTHSKALHGVHNTSAAEKGFLMVVLAFCYCQGEPRSDGSRWILDQDLYTLLHKTDENIPAAPPLKRRSSQSQHAAASSSDHSSVDADVLLHKFVQRDYLVSIKAHDFLQGDTQTQTQLEDTSVYYTMGPRAAMEIGRKQVLFFCAEVLGQDPDPTMLQELQQEEISQEEGDEE